MLLLFNRSVAFDSVEAVCQVSLSFAISWSLLTLMFMMRSSYSLLPPPPLVFSLSQHQGLSQLIGSASGGQNTGPSNSASALPVSIQDLFPLRLTGLISLLSKGLSRVFSSIKVKKHQFFGDQTSLWSNSHIHMTTGKTIALTIWRLTYLHSYFVSFIHLLYLHFFEFLHSLGIAFLCNPEFYKSFALIQMYVIISYTV